MEHSEERHSLSRQGQPQVVAPKMEQHRIAVITGTGGLGLEAAIALARAGFQVILAGRNERKGAEAVTKVSDLVPGAVVRYMCLDLASLQSVREFAKTLHGELPFIDVLVNNAGIMSPPHRRVTEDGFELQFGVNYLSHFALTAHLLGLLRAGSSPRVVNVTSLAHRYANIDFDDLQSEKTYKPGLAYCRSKLAQALFAIELQRRSIENGWGIASMAAHPGYARTNLFSNDEPSKSRLGKIGASLVGLCIGQSATAGAASIVYAATSPNAAGGQLYGPKGIFELKGMPGRCDFARAALDQEAASHLWGYTESHSVRFPGDLF